MYFDNNDLRPIADSGTTTFDLFYVRHHQLIDVNNVNDVSSITDKILDNAKCCYCVYNDNVIHHSATSFKQYIKKIKFRVINNVFDSKDAGFSNRNVLKNKKKYLFPIYSLLILPAIIDGIRLSVEFESFSFMLHPIYCFITTFYIVKYMLLKFLGKNVSNKEY